MRLDIEYKGTEYEIEYIKKLITPFRIDPRTSRNFYLDILVLGEKEYNKSRQGIDTHLATSLVPVTLELFRTSPDNCMKYDGDGTFKVISSGYVRQLTIANNIDDKIVFSLTPKDRLVKNKIQSLSFHGDLSKVKVFTADEESILFGYAIGDRHPEDIPFMIKMFYNPQK